MITKRIFGTMPLQRIPAARKALAILKQLADECVDGKAKQRLVKRYGDANKYTLDMKPLEGMEDKPVTLPPAKVQLPPDPRKKAAEGKELDYKAMRRKEKNDIARLREKRRREAIEKASRRKMEARKGELKGMLEKYKLEKAEKKKKELEDKKNKEQQEKERQKKMKEAKQKMQERRKAKIKEWKLKKEAEEAVSISPA